MIEATIIIGVEAAAQAASLEAAVLRQRVHAASYDSIRKRKSGNECVLSPVHSASGQEAAAG